MVKHCYVKSDDQRFLEVFYSTGDDSDTGLPYCAVLGEDLGFEMLHCGDDAENKFNALLDITGDVPVKYLEQLGFVRR